MESKNYMNTDSSKKYSFYNSHGKDMFVFNTLYCIFLGQNFSQFSGHKIILWTR